MANSFFASNAGMYLGGDDWNDHGSSSWDGSNPSSIVNYGGRFGSAQIMRLLDSKLKVGYNDGYLLAVGATPTTNPTTYGAPGVALSTAYKWGWPIRWAQTGAQLTTEMQNIEAGGLPPRMFYFAGDNSGGDWGSNSSVIPVIAQYGAFLREIVNKRWCGLYCHTNGEYNDWLPAFTDNSVVARWDHPNGDGNLRPTEFGLTQPFLTGIDTPALRQSVPWHNWFSTVDPDAEFSVLIEMENTANGVNIGTTENPVMVDNFRVPVGISGFAGLGQTIEVDPTRVHFW